MTDHVNTFKQKLASIRMRQVLRQIPFTLCMLFILLGVAFATRSFAQELTREWINRLGFAPRDFWFFRWERLILSALVTNGGMVFWFALAMVALTSGTAEYLTGTWRAIIAFWGVHLVTLVLESALFLLPFYRLGFPQARALFFSRDVGPSAGYMGGLGYITVFLPKPWRWAAFGVILIILVVSLFLPAGTGVSPAVKLAADMAHLIAYPLGYITASAIVKRRNA